MLYIEESRTYGTDVPGNRVGDKVPITLNADQRTRTIMFCTTVSNVIDGDFARLASAGASLR
jgi:hypothetical protein